MPRLEIKLSDGKWATVDCCPFCKSSDLSMNAGQSGSLAAAYIFCKNCLAFGPNGETERDAVVKWNTR